MFNLFLICLRLVGVVKGVGYTLLAVEQLCFVAEPGIVPRGPLQRSLGQLHD